MKVRSASCLLAKPGGVIRPDFLQPVAPGRRAMALTIRCPNPACGKAGSVADDRAGQAVRCPHCRTKFRVGAAAGAMGEAGGAHTKLHNPGALTMLQGG